MHRIFRACLSWESIHESLERAKTILRNNQYPPSFYDPIIARTIRLIITPNDDSQNKSHDESKIEEKMFFLQYRGKVTEKFKLSLMKMEIPIKIILTLRKLKMVLPSLKPSVEKSFKSGVIYLIKCPRCNSRYVGQSVRHLVTRIKEHSRPSTPVGGHFNSCNVNEISIDDDVEIMDIAYSQKQLLIKEALYINNLKPELNTKDEYKSHSLSIKF